MASWGRDGAVALDGPNWATYAVNKTANTANRTSLYGNTTLTATQGSVPNANTGVFYKGTDGVKPGISAGWVLRQASGSRVRTEVLVALANPTATTTLP